MATIALVLMMVWFLLAFVLRTVIALRRTGDSGFRGLSGAAFSLEWWAGVSFAVALAVGLAAPVAALAGMLPLVDSGPLHAVGAVVAVIGIVTTLAAQVSMGDSWRIGVDESERTALVTTGAFGLVRNPIFTAMGITVVGFVAMVPNMVALVGLVAFVAAVEIQVRGVEEPYLERVHGPFFASYAARVGRFVPGLGRRPRR